MELSLDGGVSANPSFSQAALYSPRQSALSKATQERLQDNQDVVMRGVGSNADGAADNSEDASQNLLVTYISSGTHPLCNTLLVHYYVATLEARGANDESAESKSASIVIGVMDYEYAIKYLSRRVADHDRLAAVSRRSKKEAVGSETSCMPSWGQLSFLSPSDRIARALRASRATVLHINSGIREEIIHIAERGGHFLHGFDMRHDVAPTITAFAFRSAIYPRPADAPVGVSWPSPVLFVQMHEDSDHLLVKMTQRSKAYLLRCTVWQPPRNVITKSPRCYALWLRTQMLRDAIDLSGLDGDILQRVDLAIPVQLHSKDEKRRVQLAQIKADVRDASVQNDSMFFRKYQRKKSDEMISWNNPQTTNANSDEKEREAYHKAVESAVEAQRKASLDTVIDVFWQWMDILRQLSVDKRLSTTAPSSSGSGGGTTAGNNEATATPTQNVGPDLPHTAVSSPSSVDTNIIYDLLFQPHKLLRRKSAMRGLTLELLPAVRIYLTELEKLRKRRAMLATSAVLTASAAAKNDFFQSNVVRSLETWVKVRLGKTLGRVSNLVGARMSVDLNWRTEAHPRFGYDMRADHYPFFRRDGVMLDNASTPLTPLPVIRSRNQWRRVVQLDPVLFRFKTLTVQMGSTISKLCKRLVCSPGNLSLVHSRPIAVNTVLRSLPFLPGDTILMVEPPLDGSFTFAACYLEKALGVTTKVLRFNPYGTDEEYRKEFAEALVAADPVLCMMTMISPSSSRVFPTDYFVSLCAQRAVLSLVDGTDAVGNITVHVAELDCDVFIARLDNYMYASPGVTALVVKPKMNTMLTTLTVSYFYQPMKWGEVSEEDGNSRSEDAPHAFNPDGDQPRLHTSIWGVTGDDDDSLASPSIPLTTTAVTNNTPSATSHDAIVSVSSYANEWWYTGLSDMSSILAVQQALQFRKLICFGGSEYCTALARDAHKFLCRVWQVEPIAPLSSETKENDSGTNDKLFHAIITVPIPRSESKVLSDAAHVQQLLREMQVFVSVVALVAPRESYLLHNSSSCSSPSLAHHGRTPLMRPQTTVSFLAVRLSVQVYNEMRDIKTLAAAVIRVVTACGW